VRRSGWRVPLAAVATIAASGSVAYAGQAALNHHAQGSPALITPANPVLTQAAATAANATIAAALASFEHPNPHGTIVGRGHPKTGKAKGHPDKHDAGNHGANNPNKTAPSIPHFDLIFGRVAAGSVGVSSP